jgi:hypothetical protein
MVSRAQNRRPVTADVLGLSREFILFSPSCGWGGRQTKPPKTHKKQHGEASAGRIHKRETQENGDPGCIMGLHLWLGPYFQRPGICLWFFSVTGFGHRGFGFAREEKKCIVVIMCGSWRAIFGGAGGGGEGEKGRRGPRVLLVSSIDFHVDMCVCVCALEKSDVMHGGKVNNPRCIQD